MRRVIVAAVLGVCLATAARAEDGPFTITFKRSGPGDVIRDTKTEKSANKITFVVMGTEQVKDDAGSSRLVFTDEVVERPEGAKRPTRLKRTYETVEVTKNGATEDLGLAGKTVRVEKQGDKYAFTFADGKEVPAKASELLGKEFNGNAPAKDVLLPKKPVKVGETWKPDVVEMTKAMSGGGLTIDAARSTATATLTKVYEKDGRRFGVLEVKLDVAVTKLGGGGQEVALKDGSKLGVEIVLDVCIDGTVSTGSAKSTIKGLLTGELNGVGIALAMDVTGSDASEEVRKK